MTYEYLCGGCGHEWEAEQPISAKPLKRCPKCGKNQAKRQISGGTGFVLKGGGWYADLYGSPSAKKAEPESSTKSDKTGSSDKTTSDKSGSETPSKGESKKAAGKSKPRKTAA